MINKQLSTKIILKTYILIFLIFLACQTKNDIDFISKFKSISNNQLNKNCSNPYLLNKETSLITDSNDLMKLGIPVNEIEFSNLYYPKNQFYYFYKHEINSNFFLVSYIKYYHQHSFKQYLSIYDLEKDKILSTLVISERYENYQKSIKTNYDGFVFNVETNFKINLQNGFDNKKDNSNKVLREKFIVNKKMRFEKITQ